MSGDRTEKTESAVVGYSAFEVGLNNQKMALVGLFHHAWQQRAAIALPSLVLFDPARGVHGRVPLGRIFVRDALDDFARAYGIAIVDAAPVDNMAAFDCFMAGSRLIAGTGLKGMGALDEFAAQFFQCLRPVLAQAPMLRRLQEAVFRARQVQLVVQLRIEKDWAAYSEATLDPILAAQEDYKPGFLEVFDKIALTLPAQGSVYIVCDETDLPTGKDEIRATVRARYGIDLIWKSDLLTAQELEELSLLEQSVIDFEMAVAAPAFVGMSRSTFANMACFESFCRRRATPTRHFIYNRLGPRLGRRYDHGSAVVPTVVCDPLQGRIPLVAPSAADVALPVTLLTHLSGYGDFTTEACRLGGASAGPLCCGHRGNGQRLIEGLSFASHVPDLGLDYRVRLSNGQWTAWHSQGAFAGTRGLGQQLSGLSLRLTGPLSLSYTAHLVASFAGRSELVQASAGQDCVAETPLSLEAVQLIFRRREDPR